MAIKIFMAVFVAVFFIGCAPKFSENSPVYYDEDTKTTRLKSGACALPFGTKLDLSNLTEKERKQYLGRFALNNAPDFCYKNKVSHITMYLQEINYNIYCTCDGQRLRK